MPISGRSLVVWSGELSEWDSTTMLASPVRTQLCQNLMCGDAVVWLMIRSKSDAKNAAMRKVSCRKEQGAFAADRTSRWCWAARIRALQRSALALGFHDCGSRTRRCQRAVPLKSLSPNALIQTRLKATSRCSFQCLVMWPSTGSNPSIATGRGYGWRFDRLSLRSLLVSSQRTQSRLRLIAGDAMARKTFRSRALSSATRRRTRLTFSRT